ncbi:two-component system, OmpR family, bacitracin resistance sensor histidine kinase BceS [Evansella caseinilytica]|uniref:histidine kinase n=1 Tax=Evansella caseinilytica TaxID=1503961 RepID=A0A1H3RIV2_9BACI|nr:sensor histidine kinase [Evansella caseinilytica]SDZ25533.1 two-component system, OmpR family, bacitracin resistance sensor histidine kinase BceS [Evansella caseinilytica]
MIKAYFIERRSWILFYVFLHGLTIFIAYLDAAIPLRSVLYIVLLSLMVFTVFVIVRCRKETAFYQRLEEWETDIGLTTLPEGESPLEKIIEEKIASQTRLLLEKASLNQQSLEQEKDELLSWIHEMKTPLTAMHLIIDRLEDETTKAQLTYEWLRIHLLLDKQLHQKRIPFIENDLYFEAIDIEAMLYKEIKELQSWCIQKGIGFDIQLQVTEVVSDYKWLSFIIRQLLSNAVKYSNASDIVVTSRSQDDQTIIDVKDSGRGIDSKDISRIFEKGFTSTAKERENTATGMGLYLAKKAAQPLLIHIDVQSQAGAGTTFTLIFPRKNEFANMLRGCAKNKFYF